MPESGGYQPDKGFLDDSNPPQGGSGLEFKASQLRDALREAVDKKMGLEWVQDDQNKIESKLKKIEDHLEALERKLELIFNGHVLINGKFYQLEKLEGTFKIKGVEIKC